MTKLSFYSISGEVVEALYPTREMACTALNSLLACTALNSLLASGYTRSYLLTPHRG